VRDCTSALRTPRNGSWAWWSGLHLTTLAPSPYSFSMKNDFQLQIQHMIFKDNNKMGWGAGKKKRAPKNDRWARLGIRSPAAPLTFQVYVGCKLHEALGTNTKTIRVRLQSRVLHGFSHWQQALAASTRRVCSKELPCAHSGWHALQSKPCRW
jgi:hypothetical protein